MVAEVVLFCAQLTFVHNPCDLSSTPNTSGKTTFLRKAILESEKPGAMTVGIQRDRGDEIVNRDE